MCAVILVWWQAGGPPRSEVVGDSPREGWKTVAYEGVHVDIPSAWERVDTSNCDSQVERWAPPEPTPCSYDAGAAFYGSSTFDPAHGPGVRRTTENGIATWYGYVFSGEFAVYASDADRDLVQEILDSARMTQG